MQDWMNACRNYRAIKFLPWTTFTFAAQSASGNRMANPTGNAPVALAGTHSQPVPVAPTAARFGKIRNVLNTQVVAINGARIWNGMKDWKTWLKN